MNLLDTGPLLWTLTDPAQLSKRARTVIETGQSVLSIASYWEIVIKSQKGLLPIADPVTWWARAVSIMRAEVLPIRASHITALVSLPSIHRDPFDRILIAQALAEGWPLITSDEHIKNYAVRTIW